MPLGRPHLNTDSQPGFTFYERYLMVKPEHISANLQITVAPEVAPGKYDISAHLSYKAADVQANVTDQVLDFNVPVSVSRSVASNIPFPERHPVAYAILLPLAVIAYFPFCLVKFLIGQGGCGS